MPLALVFLTQQNAMTIKGVSKKNKRLKKEMI
jgi:hypothetical protein